MTFIKGRLYSIENIALGQAELLYKNMVIFPVYRSTKAQWNTGKILNCPVQLSVTVT